MIREMPPKALGLYAKFTTTRKTDLELAAEFDEKVRKESDRGIEESLKKGRVRELFKQGTNILDELGISPEGTKDTKTKPISKWIRVHTPSVAIDVQGEEVNFIIQGFKPNNNSSKSPSANSYEYISVHKVKEGDIDFEDNTDWLFHIHERKIKTPFDETINDSEVIDAASGLINVISQSLSETHTPRSLQPKPEPKPSFFRRIIFPKKT